MDSITFKEFSSFIKENKFAVIDVGALRCPACVMLMPIIEQMSNEKEFKDKIAFAKIDVDENPEIAVQFDIDRIPVILIFKSGKLVAKLIGFQDKETLKNKIYRFL